MARNMAIYAKGATKRSIIYTMKMVGALKIQAQKVCRCLGVNNTFDRFNVNANTGQSNHLTKRLRETCFINVVNFKIEFNLKLNISKMMNISIANDRYKCVEKDSSVLVMLSIGFHCENDSS